VEGMGVSLNEWRQEIWVLQNSPEGKGGFRCTFVASRWPDGNSPCSREKEVK